MSISFSLSRPFRKNIHVDPCLVLDLIQSFGFMNLSWAHVIPCSEYIGTIMESSVVLHLLNMYSLFRHLSWMYFSTLIFIGLFIVRIKWLIVRWFLSFFFFLFSLVLLFVLGGLIVWSFFSVVSSLGFSHRAFLLIRTFTFWLLASLLGFYISIWMLCRLRNL